MQAQILAELDALRAHAQHGDPADHARLRRGRADRRPRGGDVRRHASSSRATCTTVFRSPAPPVHLGAAQHAAAAGRRGTARCTRFPARAPSLLNLRLNAPLPPRCTKALSRCRQERGPAAGGARRRPTSSPATTRSFRHWSDGEAGQSNPRLSPAPRSPPPATRPPCPPPGCLASRSGRPRARGASPASSLASA